MDARNQQKGFTLIELMMTVAIVGVLAALVYPSYRQIVLRSNRLEAKVWLIQTAIELEKCYAAYFRYDKFGADADGKVYCAAANQFSGGATFDTPKGYYRLSANLAVGSFVVTATPLATQTADTRCGSLSLDDQNTRSRSGVGTLTECW